jgi:hypothetical protein
MTSLFSDAAEAKLVATKAVVAIGAVALMAGCVTGIAAFAGVLPESDRVASAVTAAPIIDVQVDVRRNEPNSRMGPQLKSGDFEIAAD